MNRFESLAFGLAAGAAGAAYLGAWKVAIGALLAGALSVVWRKVIAPRLWGAG